MNYEEWISHKRLIEEIQVKRDTSIKMFKNFENYKIRLKIILFLLVVCCVLIGVN